MADHKRDCRVFKTFDEAYFKLVSAVVKQDDGALCQAYGAWLLARRDCMGIVDRAAEAKDMPRLHAVNTAVKDAFDSLNGGWGDFLDRYAAYRSSRAEALAVLCPRGVASGIWDALILCPNLYGVGFDLKKYIDSVIARLKN